MSYALALHLLTLLLLAAGSIGSVVLHVALSRTIADRPLDAITIAKLGRPFGMLASLSAMAMVVSGMLLLGFRGWADVGAGWFLLKISLFIALMLNGRLVAAPNVGRLVGSLMTLTTKRDAMDQGTAAARAAVTETMRRLTRFHVVQNVGLVTMVLLAVFGPR